MTTLWEKSFSTQLNIPLFDPAILLIAVYTKVEIHVDTWNVCGLAVPISRKMTNKQWCIHTMEDYSALLRGELLIHATTCVKLLNILSERSLPQKGVYFVISSAWNSRTGRQVYSGGRKPNSAPQGGSKVFFLLRCIFLFLYKFRKCILKSWVLH